MPEFSICPTKEMSVNSVLCVDVLGVVFSFMDNESLYHNALAICKEWNSISEKYLDPTGVESISEDGYRIYKTGATKQPAICYASKYGNVQMAKRLLQDSKVDPAVNNNEPLRLAAIAGHDGLVKLLLETGKVNPSDVEADETDTRDRESIFYEPIIYGAISGAVIAGHNTTVKLMLSQSNVHIERETMEELIWCAINEDDLELAHYYWAEYGLEETEHEWIIYECLKLGSLDVATYLIEQQLYTQLDDKSIVHAVIHEATELVETLINQGIDPSANHNLALQLAVEYEYHDIILLLLRDERVVSTWIDSWWRRKVRVHGSVDNKQKNWRNSSNKKFWEIFSVFWFMAPYRIPKRTYRCSNA
jgi:ankyrin repeat protein